MQFNVLGHEFYFLSDERQIGKAMKMLEIYVFKPEIIILFIAVLAYFIARIIAKTGKKEKLLLVLKKISPWLYLAVILGITVFNRSAGIREIRLTHDNWFTAIGFHESNVLGFLFNVILYIPYGYLLAKWLRVKNSYIIDFIVIVGTSLMAEALQYILARGITSIDDLLSNIIGGFMGIGIAVLIKKFKRGSVM